MANPLSEKNIPRSSEMADLSRTETGSKRRKEASPLERLASRASQLYPAEGAIEPMAADGMAMIAERRHQYVFGRLAKPMPLPGKLHYALMVGALFLVMFLAGWNDGSQGPLLPSLQRYYSLDYLVISIIWIFNALGFFLSGITNVWLSDRLGFGISAYEIEALLTIVAPLGSVAQMLGYVFMCWGGPYPLFCFAFVLIGFGLGLQVNSLVSRMPGASTLMFLMHAVYGLGATVSPLVLTQFVKHVQDRVYLYYAVSLGLAIVTAITLILVFQFRTDDQVVGFRDAEVIREKEERPAIDNGVTHNQDAESGATAIVSPGVEEVPTPTDPSAPDARAAAKAADKAAKAHQSGSKMKRIIRSPAIYLLSAYILIYVGVEVTIGGWATSFLLEERNGDNSSGYVSSGFFGGLTVGRVILIPVTAWLGGWNSVWVYTVIAIALEVVVWTVKNLIGDAIAFSFAGVALGPMYPIVMMVVVDIIPPELQSGAIGLIASIGQVGSALLPFITGAISERHGVWTLQPFMIALMGFSLVIWFFVPRKPVKA